MKQIYLDNGATSFPKAPQVGDAIRDYIVNIGTNVNRGTYDLAYSAEDTLYETRELIGEIFNFKLTENIVFTKSITESLNILSKGLLKSGDHIIVSSMEHNALMRPLNSIENIEITKVLCNREGYIDPRDVELAIRDHTKAIFILHGSNVSGSIFDLKAIGKIAQAHNIYFVVDSAQTAGFTKVDFQDIGADAIGFTGHKSLLGPQGIGGFLISKDLQEQVKPLIEGGTGSLSDEEVQPKYMPDKFEAGTLNIPGVYGLNASLKYLLQTGIDNIKRRELDLTELFIEEILNMDGISLIGSKTTKDRCPLVSLDFINKDNGIIAYSLSKHFGIMTRAGMHCAPSAHKTLGTFPRGTVRFSIGHFNQEEEIKYTIDSINKIVKDYDKYGI